MSIRGSLAHDVHETQQLPQNTQTPWHTRRSWWNTWPICVVRISERPRHRSFTGEETLPSFPRRETTTHSTQLIRNVRLFVNILWLFIWIFLHFNIHTLIVANLFLFLFLLVIVAFFFGFFLFFGLFFLLLLFCLFGFFSRLLVEDTINLFLNLLLVFRKLWKLCFGFF